jgi:predicted metal-dependent peptidase
VSTHGAGDLRAWLSAFVRESGFLARYPYYAHVVAHLTPVADPSVPAMGLSLHEGRYYLHVNVDAMMRAPQFLLGILLHEVHHVVLGHLAHPKFFGREEPDLMQIAQETSANEHIEEELPDPIVWEHFERFGLRAGQSTLDRYEILCAARAEGEKISLARDTRFVDEHPWREQPAPPPDAVRETREMIADVRDRGAGDAERAPERARRIAGRTPDEILLELGGGETAEVFIDWRDALRSFVAHTRAPVHTWSRPSRRFPARIGVVPGRTYRLRPALRPTLLVAIDTSLSMSEGELSEIALQLRPMSELARLIIVECDAAIARTYPFNGALDRVKGRGGTDLRPVFEPSFLRALGADGVVYFTDGQGPHPEAPPSIPVLWMLTKPDDFACPWGLRARLERPRALRR